MRGGQRARGCYLPNVEWRDWGAGVLQTANQKETVLQSVQGSHRGARPQPPVPDRNAGLQLLFKVPRQLLSAEEHSGEGHLAVHQVQGVPNGAEHRN